MFSSMFLDVFCCFVIVFLLSHFAIEFSKNLQESSLKIIRTREVKQNNGFLQA